MDRLDIFIHGKYYCEFLPRSFMQFLAGLPFLRFLKPDIKKSKEYISGTAILNGTVWESSNYMIHIVLWDYDDNNSDVYRLLSRPYEAAGRKGTAVLISHFLNKNSYNGTYTEEEMRDFLSFCKRREDLELRLYNNETDEVMFI